jgi:hypothetical protein
MLGGKPEGSPMGPPSQQSHNAPPKATASAPVQNAPVMEEDPGDDDLPFKYTRSPEFVSGDFFNFALTIAVYSWTIPTRVFIF